MACSMVRNGWIALDNIKEEKEAKILCVIVYSTIQYRINEHALKDVL